MCIDGVGPKDMAAGVPSGDRYNDWPMILSTNHSSVGISPDIRHVGVGNLDCCVIQKEQNTLFA